MRLMVVNFRTLVSESYGGELYGTGQSAVWRRTSQLCHNVILSSRLWSGSQCLYHTHNIFIVINGTSALLTRRRMVHYVAIVCTSIGGMVPCVRSF